MKFVSTLLVFALSALCSLAYESSGKKSASAYTTPNIELNTTDSRVVSEAFTDTITRNNTKLQPLGVSESSKPTFLSLQQEIVRSTTNLTELKDFVVKLLDVTNVHSNSENQCSSSTDHAIVSLPLSSVFISVISPSEERTKRNLLNFGFNLPGAGKTYLSDSCAGCLAHSIQCGISRCFPRLTCNMLSNCFVERCGDAFLACSGLEKVPNLCN